MTIPNIDKEEVALFCDFDGTLVDIAPHPSAVLVTDELKQLLVKWHEQAALALVTGRSLDNLKGLIGLNLTMAGSHGAEWQFAGETAQTIAFNDDDFFFIKQSVAAFAEQYELLMEDKRFSIALHFRGKEALEGDIDHFFKELCASEAFDGNHFKLMQGKAIREVKPRNINKGLALKRFMSQPPFANKTPIFIGDDVTDEDAFSYVNEHQGLSIKVGEGITQAQYRLANPQNVLQFLQNILEK